MRDKDLYSLYRILRGCYPKAFCETRNSL